MLHRVVNDLRTKITPEFAVIAGITGAKASLILQTKRKLSGGEDPAPMIRPVFIDIMLTLGYAADPGGGGAWIPPYPVRSCIRDLQPAITTKPHALFLKTSVIAVQGDLFVSWDRLRPTPTSELRLSVRVAEAICFRQLVRAAVG